MRQSRLFTPEQLQQLLAWRRANKSFNWIAQHFDCSIGAVRHQCLLAGVVPDGVPPARRSTFPMRTSRNGLPVIRFTPDEDGLLLSLAAQGLGPTEMGRALGRQSGTINNRLLTLRRQQQHEGISA